MRFDRSKRVYLAPRSFEASACGSFKKRLHELSVFIPRRPTSLRHFIIYQCCRGMRRPHLRRERSFLLNICGLLQPVTLRGITEFFNVFYVVID